jgi:hypothetical protein
MLYILGLGIGSVAMLLVLIDEKNRVFVGLYNQKSKNRTKSGTAAPHFKRQSIRLACDGFHMGQLKAKTEREAAMGLSDGFCVFILKGTLFLIS